MPVYIYQAKDETGQTVSGQVIAPNERIAATQVRGLGFYPMQVKPGGLSAAPMTPGASAAAPTTDQFTTPFGMQGNQSSVEQAPQSYGLDGTSAIGRTVPMGPRQSLTNQSALGTPFVQPYGSWFERSIVFPLWSGVSLTQLALFYRQFAAMLNAGMTVSGALNALTREPNVTLRAAAMYMNKHVVAGGTLSEAMNMFPHIFNKMQIMMVRSSESTGSLDQTMIRLSDYLESDAALRRMVKRETLTTKATLVLSFLLPPLFIIFLSGMQGYIHQVLLPWIPITCYLLAGWAAARYALKSPSIAFAYDAVKSYLPYFGTTIRMLVVAKFARALASLYSGGVVLPAAVGIAAQTTSNEFLAANILKTIPAMSAGAGLTDSFRQTGVFPSMFISMMATGETTGNLDMTLTKVADYYEAEAAVRLHQSVQTFNILFLLAVAGYVLYVLVQFYTNYYANIMHGSDENGFIGLTL